MARAGWSKVTRRRHKAVLSAVRGHKGARSRRYKVANESLIHAKHYASVHRRLKKRQMRSLSIVRVNAAARSFGISYSSLIRNMNLKSIKVDRKSLADLAVNNIEDFGEIVRQATTP